MFAYERGPWTDEYLNPAPSKTDFELPHVEAGLARWRWIDRSEWKIEGATSGSATPTKGSKESDGRGWIYYDNKWNDGRRDVDSWGRYTRRRKWYRDAELVEVTPSTEITPSPTPNPQTNPDQAMLSEVEDEKGSAGRGKISTPSVTSTTDEDANSVKSKKQGWFAKKERRQSADSSDKKSSLSVRSERDGPEEDHLDKWKSKERDDSSRHGYGLGEDAMMGLS